MAGNFKLELPWARYQKLRWTRSGLGARQYGGTLSSLHRLREASFLSDYTLMYRVDAYIDKSTDLRLLE